MSALLQIETEIVHRLESVPFFAPFADRDSIMVDPRKNLVAEIQKKLGTLKTVIVPKVVGADDNHPDVSGVYFDDIRITVGLFQNPILKGADPAIMTIAEEVHKALKNWTPDSLSNVINPAKPGIAEIADAKLLIMSCNFETKGGFVGELPSVATPTGNIMGGGQVAISCATLGAALFYTTNNTNPIPRTGTFCGDGEILELTPGTKVKARAYLAGYLRSELLTLTVT